MTRREPGVKSGTRGRDDPRTTSRGADGCRRPITYGRTPPRVDDGLKESPRRVRIRHPQLSPEIEPGGGKGVRIEFIAAR